MMSSRRRALSFIFLGTLLILTLTFPWTRAARNEGPEEDDDFAEFDDEFDEDVRVRTSQQQSKGGASKGSQQQEGQGPGGGGGKQQQEGKARQKLDSEFDDEPEPETRRQHKDPGEGEQSSFFKEAPPDDDDDGVVVEEDEFDGLDDDEFDDEEVVVSPGKKKEKIPPKLTITPVRMPMRGWQGFWAELVMFSGIGVYLLNYILGRYKNQKMAQVFFDMNWTLFESNFSLLGDSSKVEDDQGTRNYTKMSDSIFQMWCSGRTCCEGMLVELKLLKRQDLMGIVNNIFRPMKDLVRFTVEMNKEDMDSVIIAIANKKQALKMSKEYVDLVNYCPEKRSGDKFGLPSQFVVLTELVETVSSVLDSRTSSVINKYSNYIESLHFTDQFTGLKSAEQETTKDGLVKPPDPKKLLIFTLVLPTKANGNNIEEAVEEIQPLVQWIFYTVDRFKRVRLSKEGKAKADRNRAKLEEAYLKQTHQARAEALALRKEEKRRQEKERILQEEDPEKQRRWEEKEQKREKKKKQPKMKQLKVKAM